MRHNLCRASPYFGLERVVLFDFAGDNAKLDIADLFVCKGLGNQLVDGVALGQGQRVDLIVLGHFPFQPFAGKGEPHRGQPAKGGDSSKGGAGQDTKPGQGCGQGA